MGKLEVFESKMYKQQQTNFFKELHGDIDKQKRDYNIDKLLNDIKDKRQPRIDEEKH